MLEKREEKILSIMDIQSNSESFAYKKKWNKFYCNVQFIRKKFQNKNLINFFGL